MTTTAISDRFFDNVTSFTDDLYSFATGSYLKEDEKQFWDEPFSPAAVTEVKTILNQYLAQLDAALEMRAAQPVELVVDEITGEQTQQLHVADAVVAKAAAEATAALDKLNAAHGWAIVEQEELGELRELMLTAAAAAGVPVEYLCELELPGDDDVTPAV